MKERYLGIELGGSRGHRTSLVALEFFPKDKKIFVADQFTQLQSNDTESADHLLIRLANAQNALAIGVNAPLTLPPCLECKIARCPSFERCEVDSVRWMREEIHDLKMKFPTPYTQRPVDLLLRGRWQETPFVPSDETLGSGRAPLAARMQYLKRHFLCHKLLEVYPRLAMAGIASWFKITDRELRRCRDVEEGVENRFSILQKLGDSAPPGVPNLFLYHADITLFSKELFAFDALLCALMALYGELNLLEEPELDPSWGEIARPKLLQKIR